MDDADNADEVYGVADVLMLVFSIDTNRPVPTDLGGNGTWSRDFPDALFEFSHSLGAQACNLAVISP